MQVSELGVLSQTVTSNSLERESEKEKGVKKVERQREG
jgi:hypothetical protein